MSDEAVDRFFNSVPSADFEFQLYYVAVLVLRSHEWLYEHNQGCPIKRFSHTHIHTYTHTHFDLTCIPFKPDAKGCDATSVASASTSAAGSSGDGVPHGPASGDGPESPAAQESPQNHAATEYSDISEVSRTLS